MRDGEELLRCAVVGWSVQDGVHGRGGCDGRVDLGELAGVGGDFEGDEGAVGVDDAFVDAEEVLVDAIDGQEGGVRGAGVVGGESGEGVARVRAGVGVRCLGQAQGGYVAGVAGNVKMLSRCDSCQSCGGEKMAEEHDF